MSLILTFLIVPEFESKGAMDAYIRRIIDNHSSRMSVRNRSSTPSSSSRLTPVPLPSKKRGVPVVKVEDGVVLLVKNEEVDPVLGKHLGDAITVSDTNVQKGNLLIYLVGFCLHLPNVALWCREGSGSGAHGPSVQRRQRPGLL